ncbi:hypothetical protein LMG920_18915 [Xanthomonas vesicatoria]|nr:hypothetical protein LMG920_18915 [Xanthomonas vesicatoria]
MAIEVARIIFGGAMVAGLHRKTKTVDQATRDIEHQLPALGVIEFVRQRDGEISAHGAVAASLCGFCSDPKCLRVICPCR